MMRDIRWDIGAWVAICGFGLIPAASAAPTFTGDVASDFSDASTIIIADPGEIDVGVPLAFPEGTISGNDFQALRLYLDPDTDILYVGYDFYGIGTDVDGDGDPNVSSSTLSGLGGIDEVDVGGTESITLLLDIDEDGLPDIAAGVSAIADASGFQVAQFAGTPFAPGFSYGLPLPQHAGANSGAPSAASPDYEFAIVDFSLIPTSSGSDSGEGFGLNAFTGSFSDSGIGEDFLPGVAVFLPVCFDHDSDGVSSCDGDCDDTDDSIFPGAPEICDGLDQDCSGEVDEGFDVDLDGIADCFDFEECDGLDNDGDGSIDETLPDFDEDGVCNERDSEECDGLDNDGDVFVDESLSDVDEDGLCDALDEEECDGADNDGDGAVDEGFDADNDGFADCLVDEICDDVDNDGDGSIDEDFAVPADDRTPLVGVFKNLGELAVVDNQNGGSTLLDAGGSAADLNIEGVTTTAYRPGDGKFYFVTGEGDDALYTLDPTDGTTLRIDAVSRQASNVQGMDFANANSEAYGFESGGLYAISIDGFFGCRPNCLFQIDAATAVATPLASVAVGQVRAVSFDPITGALWLYDAGTKRLSTVSAAGELTSQFVIPHSNQQNGTGVDTMFSLAHDCDGNLYGIDLAYGVLLDIDTDAEQSFWIGDYGSVAASDEDLQFGGLDAFIDGNGQCKCLTYDWQTAPPEPEPTPTPEVTPTPEPVDVPTPGVEPDSCEVDYVVESEWPMGEGRRGFHVNVVISVENPSISGWLLEFDFDGDQVVSQMWSGFYTQDSNNVLVWNESYNGDVPAGGSTSFGFLGEYSSGDPEPTTFILNGVECN